MTSLIDLEMIHLWWGPILNDYVRLRLNGIKSVRPASNIERERVSSIFSFLVFTSAEPPNGNNDIRNMLIVAIHQTYTRQMRRNLSPTTCTLINALNIFKIQHTHTTHSHTLQLHLYGNGFLCFIFVYVVHRIQSKMIFQCHFDRKMQMARHRNRKPPLLCFFFISCVCIRLHEIAHIQTSTLPLHFKVDITTFCCFFSIRNPFFKVIFSVSKRNQTSNHFDFGVRIERRGHHNSRPPRYLKSMSGNGQLDVLPKHFVFRNFMSFRWLICDLNQSRNWLKLIKLKSQHSVWNSLFSLEWFKEWRNLFENEMIRFGFNWRVKLKWIVGVDNHMWNWKQRINTN